MGKSYQRKTNRSTRRMRSLPERAVSVETADGRACFQMVLPMNVLLFDVAAEIERTASQAGLLMMKALIDEEVEQVAGRRYTHQPGRKAQRGARRKGPSYSPAARWRSLGRGFGRSRGMRFRCCDIRRSLIHAGWSRPSVIRSCGGSPHRRVSPDGLAFLLSRALSAPRCAILRTAELASRAGRTG